MKKTVEGMEVGILSDKIKDISRVLETIDGIYPKGRILRRDVSLYLLLDIKNTLTNDLPFPLEEIEKQLKFYERDNK